MPTLTFLAALAGSALLALAGFIISENVSSRKWRVLIMVGTLVLIVAMWPRGV